MSLKRKIKRFLKRNEEVTIRKRKKKAILEPLEPRMLLSADLKFVTTGAANDDLPLQNAESGNVAGLVEIADESIAQSQTQADLSPAASGSTTPLAAQVFFLDFDGAADITYEGPVTVADIEVPVFEAPDSLKGQEGAIIASILDSLQEAFSDSGLVFTADEPLRASDYSTIYIGGDAKAFAEYGPFIGLSEKIDKGNVDPGDIAFIFTDLLETTVQSAADYGSALAGYVAHEAGHLMGWEHVYQADAQNPLAAVGWKPYVHIEIAQDVRNDLIEDGKITIAGNQYDVHPRIIEALKKYPAFYYAGAVGPDGFPELIMGQSVLHPESTGIWVGHVLDMAWKAQLDTKYSETEKLQILAWAYGFPTHVAGDVWCHTLTNEFTGAPWPDFGDILNLEEPKYLASVIKHLLIEGYIGDATPGFDGNNDRTLLPTGDVSDDATPTRELGAVSDFVYDALIYNLPDLPGRQLEPQFTLASGSSYQADLNSGILTSALKTQFASNGIALAGTATVTKIATDALWQIKSDYTYYDLRINT
ncbi:MAG: zinc dependent phospholipase C family protein, partial [Deltaproteobacteria bacterium]|nr:zinc dependent phospholipase C family protein [Deltaproteobacteria bacterium]